MRQQAALPLNYAESVIWMFILEVDWAIIWGGESMSKFKFKIDKDIIIDDSDTEKLERKKRKKVAKKLESEKKK